MQQQEMQAPVCNFDNKNVTLDNPDEVLRSTNEKVEKNGPKDRLYQPPETLLLCVSSIWTSLTWYRGLVLG